MEKSDFVYVIANFLRELFAGNTHTPTLYFHSDPAARDVFVPVAADCLEHFFDLSTPVSALRRWIGKGRRLCTSLPMESWLNSGLRSLFGASKPDDHFRMAREVEYFLSTHGFRKLHARGLPISFSPARWFGITSWERL